VQAFKIVRLKIVFYFLETKLKIVTSMVRCYQNEKLYRTDNSSRIKAGWNPLEVRVNGLV